MSLSLRKLLGAKGHKTLKNGFFNEHPVFAAGLGVCSALAVTNRVANSLAMGAGVTFVLVATSLIIAPLRKLIPQRVRIITYMITISTFVIIVDRFLKAFFPEISESVGPYVGLIITNCIIMGRAEAFFSQNTPYYSLLDAISNGLAYSLTMIIVGVIRELLGFGSILGWHVMPAGWENWLVMTMAPGAFFILGLAIWVSKERAERAREREVE